MTIAVLAALSSTTFAVGLPTDYSQTQTLSGNYEIAEDITISKQGYLPKILFQTSEDGAHISLTGDTSIKLIDGGDSRGGALFVNNTDKKLTFDGIGKALSIAQEGNSSGTREGSFISGKNIDWNNLSSLSISTNISNQRNSSQDGFLSALFLTGSSSINLAPDSAEPSVNINVKSSGEARRLYGAALNGGQLTVSNADQVNISLELNRHSDNGGRVNSSAGIAFVSDKTQSSEPQGSAESSLFDVGEATLNITVTRASGSEPLAGIAYENFTSSTPLTWIFHLDEQHRKKAAFERPSLLPERMGSRLM